MGVRVMTRVKGFCVQISVSNISFHLYEATPKGIISFRLGRPLLCPEAGLTPSLVYNMFCRIKPGKRLKWTVSTSNQRKWFPTHLPKAIFFNQGKGLFDGIGFTETEYFRH